MSWQKKFDGTAERLAARHADKINNAMSKGINVAAIVRAWLETQPSPKTTREQAAVWVHHNVIPNTEPLEAALKDIYVEGYALGQAFAATAYARAKLSIKKAAPTGDDLRAAFETDWDNWQAGSEAQALKTEKPGALQDLFDRAAISEKTKIWKNSMDRLGVVMADTARAGLGVSTTQQAIIEAQIGWGFDEALKDPYKAMRIARTEINRAQSLATMDTYREYGLEKVEWLASEGECDICSGNMDLGPQPIDFEWDSIEGGTTEPPAHPNCLCTLMPALDNEPTTDEAQVEGETDQGDQVELPADVEAADLSAVAVDLPEAEQPSTDGTITNHEAEPVAEVSTTTATNIDNYKPAEYKELAALVPDRLNDNVKLQDAIAEYTGNSYVQMNEYLREGRNISDKMKEHVDNLQTALESQTIPSDMQFQRGQYSFNNFTVNTNQQGELQFEKYEYDANFNRQYETMSIDSIVGQTWESEGFLSTTTATDWQGNAATNRFQNYDIQIHVLAPAGTQGMVVNSYESEFLMPHGTTFEIVKTEAIGIQAHVWMKVINQ